MKFYANLSGRKFFRFFFIIIFFFIRLQKSYNLLVQLNSQLHHKSCTSSIFLGLWVNLSSCLCGRQRLVEFFVLSLHLIFCVKEWLGKVTVPGNVSVVRGVWGVVPGRREGQGQSSRLDTHRGSGAKLCREQISRPWQLLNNLPWSAGIIKILHLYRKLHDRLTWRQGFILALVFQLVLYFCLGLLGDFECSLPKKKTPSILNYFVMKASFWFKCLLVFLRTVSRQSYLRKMSNLESSCCEFLSWNKYLLTWFIMKEN